MSGEVRLAPTAMVAGGAALARDDTGRVVFVDGALPGEIVTARLTETRVDFARAVAVDILEPSPDRVFPPCPALAAGCGGCSWQHIAPAAQVKLKAGIVVDALRRIGHLREPPEPTVVALDGPALRTTARLAVSPGGRAGYRPRGEPGQAVETDSCLAAHPLVEELIVAGCYPGAAEVLLRAAVASGERMVRVSPRGVVDQVRVPSGVVVLAEGDRGAAVHETVAARPFQISVDSFFQSGPVAAAGLGAAVLDALDNVVSDGGHVVDAYAGVGLFASLIGARLKARVTAIEIGRSAVADARVNLADVDARVLSLDVDKWRPRRGDHPIEAVVADPPRSGLGRSGSSAVVGARSPRIVLVSCDPASLGRDTALLRRAGYNLASVAVIDAFPHTSHVETVSRFDRGAKESIAGE